MLDMPAQIRTYLLTNSALVALVGAGTPRIWAERVLPIPGYNPTLQGGAVAFRMRGGNAEYSGVLNPSVQFKCYGATEEAAHAVYRALYDALHDPAAKRPYKQSLCEVLGQTLDEPDTGWPFVLTFFRFWF